MLKLTYCNLHHHLILTLIGNMMINQAETDFSPLQVSDLPQKYQVDHAEQLLQWLGNLADPAEPVRSVSWFQIYALYGYQDAKEHDIRPRRKSGLTGSMMSNTLILWDEPITCQTGYNCFTCGRKETASNSGHYAYRIGFYLERCSWRMIFCLTHKRRSTVSVLSGTSGPSCL